MKHTPLVLASLPLLLALALPRPALAGDLIQFDDSTEHVQLLLNGSPVLGDTGPISKLAMWSIPEPSGDNGEVITFEYRPGGAMQLFDSVPLAAPLPYVYTQLWEAGPVGTPPIVSDEFGILPIADAEGNPDGFLVIFTSADFPWLLSTLPPGSVVNISALSAFEEPRYQDVAYLVDGANVSVFQVNSVPEPETYAMLLAGLGAIGLLRRRAKA